MNVLAARPGRKRLIRRRLRGFAKKFEKSGRYIVASGGETCDNSPQLISNLAGPHMSDLVMPRTKNW